MAATSHILQGDPSQISFKAIQAMFINEGASKMSSEIVAQNKDMVHRTLDFEKELRQLEQASRKAKQSESKLKNEIRNTKSKMRNEKAKDFLTVISTPNRRNNELL